jgi:hypothetical protein
MGPRSGLHDMEKEQLFILPGFELRPLSRPARTQSLMYCSKCFVGNCSGYLILQTSNEIKTTGLYNHFSEIGCARVSSLSPAELFFFC